MYLKKDYALRTAFVLISAALLFSCAHEPVNLGLAKQQLINYHESGRYDKDVAAAVEGAIDRFDRLTLTDSL